MPDRDAPLVLHVTHGFAAGGLENGVLNLINHGSARFRHAVMCLTAATDFADRLQPDKGVLMELHKQPGRDPGAYLRAFRVLSRLQPSVVHTRNYGTMDVHLLAWLRRVPVRLHAEHGRDMNDLRGTNAALLRRRRMLAPLITHFAAVSADLQQWLHESLHRDVHLLENGVDLERFHPEGPGLDLDGVFGRQPRFVVASVGRMAPVKGHEVLVQAFIAAAAAVPDVRLCLVIGGDGECHARCVQMLQDAGLADRAWLPGLVDRVPDLMRAADLFVLPSLAEGMSNTLLEAMASGLPAIATRVGDNPRLVVDGTTGSTCAPADADALARCIVAYASDPALARAHGGAGRQRAISQYAISAMVSRYEAAYAAMLSERLTPNAAAFA